MRTGATRLVLVEGIIGIGKSTTAEHIAEATGGRAYHEFAPDHPIRTAAVDHLRATYPSAVSQAPPGEPDGRQWRALAERCAAGHHPIVLEATFLQNSVLPAFLDGAPQADVVEHCARIERDLAPARPLLVYLRPTDVAASLANAHADRGEPWSSWNLASITDSAWARARQLTGTAALVGFWRAWEALVDELYGRYPYPKRLFLDPQSDRQAVLTAVVAALS
ncbi:MAG TPA: hypothetical protein VFW65_05775 [Pseudonocardiaceae bacterium]|nr:hypothetical protein [Pseudonocardiaceae bacterium]